MYDLGGGTFDVTLMEIDGPEYRTLATAGDVHLGGIDWDRRIVDQVAEVFRAQHHGLDPRANPAGFQRLLREAEDAKRAPDREGPGDDQLRARRPGRPGAADSPGSLRP